MATTTTPCCCEGRRGRGLFITGTTGPPSFPAEAPQRGRACAAPHSCGGGRGTQAAGTSIRGSAVVLARCDDYSCTDAPSTPAAPDPPSAGLSPHGSRHLQHERRDERFGVARGKERRRRQLAYGRLQRRRGGFTEQKCSVGSFGWRAVSDGWWLDEGGCG